MRKTVIIFILLILGGGSIYYLMNADKVQMEIINLALNEDKQKLTGLVKLFIEDIRFKDFEKAASYHSPEDQKKVDIPKLIERMFKVKPEFLDIMEYEVTDVELDRTGTRARVKVLTKVRVLNTDEIREPEAIFYWQKDDQGVWRMKLESSLR